MPIPVEQLPAFLRDLATGLKEGQCLAAKEGVNFIFDKDSISVEIEVIAKGGLNQIERRARQKSGEKVSEETRPEIVSESIQAPYTKTQSAKPATSTTTTPPRQPKPRHRVPRPRIRPTPNRLRTTPRPRNRPSIRPILR
jgi:hypothetical protein